MGRSAISIPIAVVASLVAGAPLRAERVPSAGDTRQVLIALSTASEDERPAWRWRLARDYAARGLYAEADGVLRVLAADTPAWAETREFRLLHAEILTAIGDAEAAIALLDSPIVEGTSEACLRRLAANARLQRNEAVSADSECARPALRRLPEVAQTPILMAEVRAEFALGNIEKSESQLSRLTALTTFETGEAEYWRGAIAARRQQTGLAIEHFQKAMLSPHPVAALRAEVAIAELRVASGALAPATALKQLTKLAHSWRGGAAERDLLMALARLSDLSGDVRGAFSAYGVIAQYLPQNPQSPSLSEQLAARFSSIFTDGGLALEPVDAFALFWDFRDFAPQGPAADAMVRRLADRLAGLGLSVQAASLLEHQVYNRLDGTARGIVAVRLASLLNDGGQHARALGVLAATKRESVSADIEAELVEAAALVGLGRPTEAKALLAGIDGDRARLLRADAAWSARDWGAVIDQLAGEMPAVEDIGTPVALNRVLRVAVAAAMDGDEVMLRRLNHHYSVALSKTGIGPAFEILTGEPGSMTPEQFRSALAEAAAHASGQSSLGKSA